MNIKSSKKGTTYSISEQYKDKSKHPDERLTKMIFVTSNLRGAKSLYNTGDKY